MFESFGSSAHEKKVLILSPERYEETFKKNIEELHDAVESGDTETIAKVRFYIEKHKREMSEYVRGIDEIDTSLSNEILSDASKAILIDNRILLEKIVGNLERYIHEYQEVLTESTDAMSSGVSSAVDPFKERAVHVERTGVSARYSLAEVRQYRQILNDAAQSGDAQILNLLEEAVTKYTTEVTSYEVAIGEIDTLLRREENSDVTIALYTNNKILLEQTIAETQQLIDDYRALLTKELGTSASTL